MKLFLSIVALICTSVLGAQQTGTNTGSSDAVYLADARIQIHDLKNYISVFADSSNKLTIQEIASGKFNNRFQPISGITKLVAQPLVTYWLKFTISTSGDIQDWWLVLHSDPEIGETVQHGYLDSWFINRIDQTMEHQRSGVFVPRSQKSIREKPGLNRVFFSAKAGETKDVYLKIYNEFGPGITSSLELRNPIAGFPSEKNLGVIFGSGAVFFFAIISFFFFFFVRDKAYLFFGLYALTLSQHYLILHPDIPFIDLYIPEFPHLVTPVFVFLTIGGFIFFALFGRAFINLPQLSKRLDTSFKWVMAVWIAYLIIILALMIITRRTLLFEGIYIFIFLFLIFLIRVAFFKTILVRFYVAGALWLFCFTLLGIFFFSQLPFNPWPIGQIGQILIYAAGLAYKVRMNEKARAQADLIRLRNVELANLYEESKQQKEEIEIQKKNADEALVELKAAQAQLIQNEKMASLGELTAGIAHEIKNPLNFVNNFSEVNAELIDEMRHEIDKGNLNDIRIIATTIKDNQQKITYHGKRADDIVKSMLQHSRSSTGIKEPTNINALADEYLRLAYHGLRAKDKMFDATTKTDFDESIGDINIIPQDIGRVILNLITNAFYAVAEKRKQQLKNYEPVVAVSTKKVKDKVEIKVKDNGNGIPQKVLDKIFQPFFTTKPTGQGTGLGLSLSYDIVKSHGGELKVETKEGEGSEFLIRLPVV
jgi:signal transduction histidine kinase